MQYSHNDHYKWGWNEGWFNDPIVGGDFKVQIGACTRKPMSFRKECIRAAKLVFAQFTKPVLIGLSGGSDSQVVCLSFLEAKLPFTPLVLKLMVNGAPTNEHDIAAAFAFCEKFKLTPRVEEVDVEAWYNGRGFELAKEHLLTNAETLIQLWSVEKFKDTHAFVMGGGDAVITKSKEWQADDPVVTSFGPTPIQQHLIKHNIEGVTKFFMYTPELIASYLDNDIMHAFYAAEVAIYDAWTRSKGMLPRQWWWCFNLYIKPLLYVKEWPELIQQRKYTGFENMYEDLVPRVIESFSELHKPYDMLDRKIIVRLDDLRQQLNNKGAPPKVWVNNGAEVFKNLKALG